MSIRVNQRGGDRYEIDIRWKDHQGVKRRDRCTRRFASLENAQAWAESHERLLILHGKAERRRKVPTAVEFWERFMSGYVLANRQKPSEVKSKQSIWDRHLKDRFAKQRLDTITTEQIQVMKGELGHLSPKRVNNILTVLRTMLRQAVRWGVIATMPEITEVKTPDVEMEFYDEQHYERVVDASRQLGPHYYLSVLLAGDAGLRAGEIRGLRWRDIDHKQSQLRVQQAEWRGHITAPKSWQSRTIPLTPRLAEALAAHRHLKHERAVLHKGEPVTEKTLRVMVERCIRKAGVAESARPVHRLRHTFGTRLAAAGATAKQIQALMGHKNLTTTQRYLHLSPSNREAAIALLSGDESGNAAAKRHIAAPQKTANKRDSSS